MVSEDAADFTLKFDGTPAELRAKFGREGSQAFVADLEADFGYRSLGGEHLTGAVHAEASQEVVWRFSKGVAEEAVEMEFGETGFAGGVLEENAGSVFGDEEIAPAAEAAEGVVMEKLRHGEMILESRGLKPRCLVALAARLKPCPPVGQPRARNCVPSRTSASSAKLNDMATIAFGWPASG